MTKALVMGIINVTPDSFSGDGLLLRPDYVEQAVMQARQMIADGAEILDIGGESSRPGSASITVAEEIRRVVPVIAAIKENLGAVTLAIDTVKAEVAARALQAGATIINDITALEGDARMVEVAAHHQASVVLMHNRATAAHHDATIGGHYDAPAYEDVVADIASYLKCRAEAALAAGIPAEKIILDPGIGFGKTAPQNCALIAQLDRLTALGFPVLMGVSRKSFIGQTLELPVNERLEGTAACVTACVLKGASILRVHDVKFMARIVDMATALHDAAPRA
jgi:dihydropteroate synthase